MGTHWEENAPKIDEPADPPIHPPKEDSTGTPEANEAVEEPMFGIATAPPAAPTTSLSEELQSMLSDVAAQASSVSQVDPAMPTRPTMEHPPDRPTIEHDGEGDDSKPKSVLDQAWDWLTDKWDKAKDKIGHLIHGDHGTGDGSWARQ